jgi:CRP-like cAMP-binding protein
MKTLRVPCHKSEARRFAVGQPIFNQGEAGSTMYVVHEGEVDLLVNGQKVEKLGPGGVLGEMGLIDAAPPNGAASVRPDIGLASANRPGLPRRIAAALRRSG